MQAWEHALDCQRYRDFSPTGFDAKGLNLDDQQDWLVAPVTRNRDSGASEDSNFEALTAMLDDVDAEYETHSFGHWACGWFEIIIVNPEDGDALEVLGNAVCALADYPLLDDDDYDERVAVQVTEAWEYMSMRDRMELCVEHGVSFMAARHDWVPSDDCGGIRDALQGY